MILFRAIQLSLTPGFSPVCNAVMSLNRFSGFSRAGKPLKRLNNVAPHNTGLKPGANKITKMATKQTSRNWIGNLQSAICNPQ